MNTNTENKIIKNKLRLLRLAETLGNVSQACKAMGYSRDSFYSQLVMTAVYTVSPSVGITAIGSLRPIRTPNRVA